MAWRQIMRRGLSVDYWDHPGYLGLTGQGVTLINAANPSDGYTELWHRGHLDITVEALVVDNPVWQPLFLPGEVEKARLRLAQYHYVPKR
jgi:hypothetical protein